MEKNNLPIKIDAKIDSADAADVLKKLIDTIRAPFSWWVKAKEPVYQAKADVKASLIRADAIEPLAEALGISKEEAVGLTLRSEQRECYRKIRQQQNVESIVQGAVEILPPTADERPVDEDWTIEFFEQCKNVSKQKMQSLWSKILSGEVAKPGTYSRRALSFIRTLSQHEAEIFTKFCSLLWHFPTIGFMHFLIEREFNTEKYGISYADMINLEATSLIKLDKDTNFTFDEPDEVSLIYYSDERYFLYPAIQNPKSKIRLPVIALTNLGNSLAPISGYDKNEEYKLEMIKEFQRNKLFVYEKPPRN